MSLSDPMDTQAVRSVMTEMEDELSNEGVCLEPKFDLKYMFTVNSKVDEQKTKPPFPDGDYGSCSAITGYTNGILHIVVAITASPNLSWGLVPGEPTLVETFHPITERSFTKTDFGKYKLVAGPLCLELDGPMYYDVMSNVGMKGYPHSEYLNGNMSIHDFEISRGHPDPRLDMMEKSLDGTYGTSVASRASANGTSASKK